ncbi:MAG: DUF2235 domain-containing protein, partial [Geminicoccaceae bacterium]|nr:DUF2235 domain-containing protein [Geminicoccaceae bacterium]
MANICVFCDGTWQTDEDEENGVLTVSNVAKMRNSLAHEDTAGEAQKRYYHPGVGTGGGRLSRLIGGGFGVGLQDNVKSAYKWLSVTYEPGDRIHLFGFSRGAYTVRSLGGMISACGLLDLRGMGDDDAGAWPRVDAVFETYRRRPVDAAILADCRFHNCDASRNPAKTTPIHFLGVWDTVGALGIPNHLGFLNLLDDPGSYAFHDTELSDIVRHARHAMAIDEERESFTPTLWTGHGPGTDIRQVWFAGAHGDTGGGYPLGESGLSDVALLWMIEEAQACGLSFNENKLRQIRADPLGPRHNPVTGVFKAMPTRPRSIPAVHDPQNRSKFHTSVLERRNNTPISDQDYFHSYSLEPNDKRTVSIYAREPWNATGLHVRKGERYRMSAIGEWIDGSIKCSARGTDDGDFYAGEMAQMAASVLGWGEQLFKRFSGNRTADFWYTKRVETSPWFALMGAIANGRGADPDGNPSPHQIFEIGDSRT